MSLSTKILAAALLAILPALATAGVRVLALVDVYDGDTFRAEVNGIGEVPVRVRGIDTPEIRGDCPFEKELAIAARETADFFLHKAAQICLSDIGIDRYGRVLATVHLDGQDLAALMLRERVAVPWAGQRNEWCGGRFQNELP